MESFLVDVVRMWTAVVAEIHDSSSLRVCGAMVAYANFVKTLIVKMQRRRATKGLVLGPAAEVEEYLYDLSASGSYRPCHCSSTD